MMRLDRKELEAKLENKYGKALYTMNHSRKLIWLKKLPLLLLNWAFTTVFATQFFKLLFDTTKPSSLISEPVILLVISLIFSIGVAFNLRYKLQNCKSIEIREKGFAFYSQGFDEPVFIKWNNINFFGLIYSKRYSKTYLMEVKNSKEVILPKYTYLTGLHALDMKVGLFRHTVNSLGDGEEIIDAYLKLIPEIAPEHYKELDALLTTILESTKNETIA